jgi:hypothetical protein
MVLDVPVKSLAHEAAAIPVSCVIPAGKPKLLLAIGSGKTRRSTLRRWVTEQAMDREGRGADNHGRNYGRGARGVGPVP